MSDVAKLQAVQLDKEALIPVSGSRNRSVNAGSESHPFNKILSNQSDKNKSSARSDNHADHRADTTGKHAAGKTDNSGTRQDTAKAAADEQKPAKNGKDLPAKSSQEEKTEASGDTVATTQGQNTATDEAAAASQDLNQVDATQETPIVQTDEDTDLSDSAQAAIAAPQNVDVLSQPQDAKATQASDTARQATISLDTQAAANAINQNKTLTQQQTSDATSDKVALTTAGIQKAVENQPSLPAQANAELRSFLKADAANPELPVSKISFQSPDADGLQQLPIFDKIVNNALQPLHAKLASHDGVLNFTTKIERIDLSQAATDARPAVDKVLHNATPLPGSDTSNSAINQVKPALELPVQHPQWGQELGNKAIWMVNHRLSEAEIRLNPKELGPIGIKISVQNDQASVHFSTHHHGVKESIESAIPRLRDALSDQGLDLVDVNVAQHDGGQAQHGGFGQSFQNSSGGGAPGLAVAEESIQQSVYSTDLGAETDRIDYFA